MSVSEVNLMQKALGVLTLFEDQFFQDKILTSADLWQRGVFRLSSENQQSREVSVEVQSRSIPIANCMFDILKRAYALSFEKSLLEANSVFHIVFKGSEACEIILLQTPETAKENQVSLEFIESLKKTLAAYIRFLPCFWETVRESTSLVEIEKKETPPLFDKESVVLLSKVAGVNITIESIAFSSFFISVKGSKGSVESFFEFLKKESSFVEGPFEDRVERIVQSCFSKKTKQVKFVD